MGRVLTLELDDRTFDELAEAARNAGQTPGDLVREAVARLVHDPLADFIGAFSSGAPGWSARHDEMIAEQAMAPHDEGC